MFLSESSLRISGKEGMTKQHAANSASVIIITNVPIKTLLIKVYLTFLLLKINGILLVLVQVQPPSSH